jgi:Phage major capsid protein E
MVSLDVFNQDPFQTIQMTTAIEKVPFLPSALGDLKIFTPTPIRTKALMVEERDGVLSLIQTSARGTPPARERTTEQRKVRYFEVPRIAEGDTVYANELEAIREFGTESELMQVQTEVARRLAGPTGIMRNVEYTWENMRLAAIQGELLDADGSTLYNWYTEFGITPPAAFAFNLAANTEFSLRPICNQVVRAVARNSKGAFTPVSQVYALCGDTFWDEFTNHQDVVRTYYNWQAAAELRKGQAFEAMYYGGIYWFNYRGSDDATTIAINTDQAKFFPVNAPGLFEVAWAPADRMEFINTLGKPMYVYPIMDRDRNQWWRQEVYSFPLFICKRPEVLQSGTI